MPRGEYRCVFDADDARPDYHHGRGNGLQVQDAVGVQHALVVEGDAFRPRGLGAGGDDDIVAANGGVFGLVVVRDEMVCGSRNRPWPV